MKTQTQLAQIQLAQTQSDGALREGASGEPAPHEPSFAPPEAPLAMPRQELHGPAARSASRRLPWPKPATLAARSLAALFALSCGAGAAWLFGVIGAADQAGLDAIDAVRLTLIFITTAWIGWGAALAVTGLVAGLADRWRARAIPEAQDVAQTRCVVLVPICNEDPVSTFARVAAMRAELAEAEGAPAIDFAILSDTRDLAVAEQERLWLDRLIRESRGRGRIIYRRRRENRGRKAGNIEEFLTRAGSAWEFALILDADSLMEAQTILTMLRRIKADPGLGLLQTLPRVIRAGSVFGRAMQFSANLYSPAFARGVQALQGNAGSFWGHNAMVRIKAFAETCGLPELPGRPPFGGAIMSHDTVEAAMLVRGGWRVRVDADLDGSFEEAPDNLIDHARRDRRWCQGNLQHSGVIGATGLSPWSRFSLFQGILAYVSPLFWLAFIAATLIGAALAPPPGPWFSPSGRPVFPIDETGKALALAGGVFGLLFLPKLLIALEASFSGRAARFGGGLRLWGSTLAEILVSSVIAPLQMMFQTRSVLQVLFGLDGGWPSQSREGGRVSWKESRAATGFIVLGGLAILAAAWVWAPEMRLWLIPLAAPMIAAPLLVRSLSHDSEGGLFLTPSEAAPASVLERHARILSGWREAAAPEPREKEKRAAAPALVEEPKLWPAQEAGSLMA